MSLTRAVKTLAVGFLAAFLLVAGGLYFLSTSIPVQYRPARLSARERVQAAKHFYGKVMDFDGQAQGLEPFEVQITQEELGNYLASLDEIAALLPDGQSGRVDDLMEGAGLADPAIALGEGMVSLMVRSGRYDNRIVSAEVAFYFSADKRLRIRLGRMRIGRLPVPEGLVRRRLEGLRQALASGDEASRGRAKNWVDSGGPVGAVADATVKAITAAIDGEAIIPEGVWRGRRLRIDAVEVCPQNVTLRVRPLGSKSDQAAR